MLARCMSRVSVLVVLMVAATGITLAQDNWLGGTGNWSNCPDWNLGCPGPANDVLIYSGGNDNVTLDVGSATINSLTLGGLSNGFSSQLTDAGIAQALYVSNTLNIGQNGELILSGGGTLTAGTLTSAGSFYINNASTTVSVTGDVLNTGTLIAGYYLYGGGGDHLNVSGTLTNSGTVYLGFFGGSGGTAQIGTLNNSGSFQVNGGSTVSITGDVLNSNTLLTGYYSGGGDTLNVGGTLTNTGLFGLDSSGDVANVATLVNNGDVSITQGATLNVAPGGLVTDIPSGTSYAIFGTFHAGPSNAVANLNSIEGTLILGNGQTTNITPGSGTLTSAGSFYINNASTTVSVTGDVLNTGTLIAGYYLYGGGGDHLNVSGTLTNSGTVYLGFFGGSGGTAQIGTLNNSGSFQVNGGSTVSITGDVLNSNTLLTGYYSGGGDTLNVGGTLTNTGLFGLDSSGDVANVATLVNNGDVSITQGATLNVAPGGLVTDIPSGTSYAIFGTFHAGPSNAVANLNSIEGTLILGNGQTTNITPGSGTLTSAGSFYINNASTTVSVTGDVLNTGTLIAGYYLYGGGGDHLNVSGTLTNSGTVYLGFFGGSGGTAQIGTLNNSGSFQVNGGSTVSITGDVLNSNTLLTGYYSGGGDTLNVGGTLTNTGLFGLDSSGDVANVATLVNNGDVSITQGATLLVGTGLAGATGYYQLANGTLGEFINMSNFGVIVVNGPVHLDGTLDVQLGQGFNPKVGSTYDFITFTPGSYDGSLFASILNDVFNNGTEMWVLVYNNVGGYIELEAQPNAVPEPSSLLLLGSGLLASLGLLRRKLMP